MKRILQSIVPSTADKRDQFYSPDFDDSSPNIKKHLRPIDADCETAMKGYENDPWRIVYEMMGLGWSATHVGCSAIEMLLDAPRLSRLYFYWALQEPKKSWRSDKRVSGRDICKALVNFGACLDQTKSYKDSMGYVSTPNDSVHNEAKKFSASGYNRVCGINNIKTALLNGKPVIASLFVHAPAYKPFFNLMGDWREHDWRDSGNCVGSHAVLITGYDDTYGRFVAESGWGNWGDGGRFGIPYEKIREDVYSGNIGKSVYEFWILE